MTCRTAGVVLSMSVASMLVLTGAGVVAAEPVSAPPSPRRRDRPGPANPPGWPCPGGRVKVGGCTRGCTASAGPIATGEPVTDVAARRLTVPVTAVDGILMDALTRLYDHTVDVLDVGLRRPTLDDVFLTLTGHTAELPADADVDEPDVRGTKEPVG